VEVRGKEKKGRKRGREGEEGSPTGSDFLTFSRSVKRKAEKGFPPSGL